MMEEMPSVEEVPAVEQAPPEPQNDDHDDPPPPILTNGTVLEAAFLHPNIANDNEEEEDAIELQMGDEEDSVITSNTQKERMKIPAKPTARQVTTTTTRGFWCCQHATQDVVVEPSSESELEQYQVGKQAALEARQVHKDLKRARREQKRKEQYETLPQGILIYRLDTATRKVELVTEDASVDFQGMIVSQASPSSTSRLDILLQDSEGNQATLSATEQRTAISWLEAMDMMLGNTKRIAQVNQAIGGAQSEKTSSKLWGGESLNQVERDEIEEQYVTLADYSNKLIRAGAIPGKTERSGIYYSVETISKEGEAHEEEALESIAKRRAVIKDSWDFYRMICSLLRDRRKYEEVFRKMQHDSVYPYLNSMTGLNDPGDDGYENKDKPVVQPHRPEYETMSKTELARALAQTAQDALPSLVEICKALAGSLGMEEVGVGPVKEEQAAIRKADKKYEGDLLKVTDYCRCLLVVKDFPSLLALLELARDSFGPLIRRVKLSTLKSNHGSMPGGYRDCKINLELKNMICEIQIHLWPMWVICGVDGYRHYRHCLEYSTDSFGDPYDALDGLDRKTVAELVVVAEEAVAETPLVNLEWFQEKVILDYFAETGLFIQHGLDAWAEITLKHLIKLRTESPDIGPDHSETLVLNQYLEKVLRNQGKNKEADQVAERIHYVESKQRDEKQEAELSLWDSLGGSLLDVVLDPNKREREEEEQLKKQVKASKKAWRKIRKERFPFLDNPSNQSQTTPDTTTNSTPEASQ